MDICCPFILLTFFICSTLAGTTIRVNFRPPSYFKKSSPDPKPFYITPAASSAESAIPAILLTSTLVSSMLQDALLINRELEKVKVDRREGLMTSLKSNIENVAGSFGQRLDFKNGLNNLYDKFHPLWGRGNNPQSFSAMLSDISNTKENELKSFKLPASIAEKLGTTTIQTSSSSFESPSRSSWSLFSPFKSPATYSGTAQTAAQSSPSPPPAQQQSAPAPAPQYSASSSTPKVQQVSYHPPYANSAYQGNRPQSPFPYPYQYNSNTSPVNAPSYPPPYFRNPIFSASHPYAVAVPPPPPTTTTPAPQPKTPRTIVIDDEEETEESDDDGTISIGGIKPQQVLKLLGGVASTSGLNLGNMVQSVISSAVSSVASGIAAAMPTPPTAPSVVVTQSPASVVDHSHFDLNPKSKDEIISEDDEVIIIRKPKKPKAPTSSATQESQDMSLESFTSRLSALASSSQANESPQDDKPSPFIKIGESKISFKPTNSGLSISFGKV